MFLMAWYNPKSWGKKKSTSTSSSDTSTSTSTYAGSQLAKDVGKSDTIDASDKFPAPSGGGGGSSGGGSSSAPLVQGPVRPGTDVETFRETGVSQPTTSGGGSSGGGQQRLTGADSTTIQLSEEQMRNLNPQQDFNQRGTINIPTYQESPVPLHTPGTTYQYQTGVESFGGKNIPIVETYFVEKDWSSKEATPEQSKALQTYIDSQANIELGLSPTPSKAKQYFSEKSGQFQDFGSQSFYDEKWVKDFSAKGGTPGKIAGGLFTGLIPSTKGGVIISAATFGAGAAAGVGYRGAMIATTKISPTLGLATKATGFGAGTYLGGTYALGKVGQYTVAKGAYEKSQVIGSAGRETAAGVYGFRVGSKGVDITSGIWSTRGRGFLETKQGVYPSAPASTHLKSFQKNIIPELGDTPGAFHTTGKKFWQSGKIEFVKGTSELQGGYGSTQVSTPFARISGSSKSKLIPEPSTILELPGEPAIAFLKPTGFRASPSKGIGGSKRAWIEPAKKGYADVPSIKGEIEAVFRPDAGKYIYQSGKYYTKIKGVRVPVDVHVPEVGFGKVKVGGGKVKVSRTSKTKIRAEYSEYSSPPVVSPASGIILSSSKIVSSKPYSSSKLSSSRSYSPSSSSVSSSYTPSKSSYLSSKSSSSSLGGTGKYSSSRKSSSTRSVVFPISPPPFIKPSIGKPKVGRKLKVTKIGGYSTSYAGYVGKIKGPEVKPGKLGFTGMEIRPLSKKGKVVFKMKKK